MGDFIGGRGVGRALCLMTIMVGITWGPSASASAAEVRVFDPQLSLTGGCTTSELDPVPDPSCPEEAKSGHFSWPTSVVSDSYGNIYVASRGQAESGSEARVDVFDSAGFFLVEKPISTGVTNIAVDSAGNLYVINASGELYRYPPTAPYEPSVGNIKYETLPVAITGKNPGIEIGLAVNPLNQHVFEHWGKYIAEYGSAAEGNKVISETIGTPLLFHFNGAGLAIDAVRGRIYASDSKHSAEFPDPTVIRVFELESPHALIGTIDGSSTPEGKFLSGILSVAVDEGTGDVFVYDGKGAKNIVYEFTKDGEYVTTFEHEFQNPGGMEIAVDNGANSPNGALNPFGVRYLFVPSHPGSVGHIFAFGPRTECPPKVENPSFAEVTETEALLQAKVNPCHLDTSYTIEYTTLQSFEAEGFAGATFLKEGQISAGGAPVGLSAAVEGLSPGTPYRFRIVATNDLGSNEAEAEFATYPESGPVPSCPNAALRTGFSALLPDCRAYELVSPPDTNARSLFGVGHLGTYFATDEASPAGDKISFRVEGGSLPGFEGTGSLDGDPYLASRGEEGWTTSQAGPNASEAPKLLPGSASPDQEYSFWGTGSGSGSASIEEKPTNYVRYPDGHSALIGRGSIGTDPRAIGRLISANGGHIIFETGFNSLAVQLEENAPPSGTRALYDRTSDEVTHVVSLLPGGITPAGSENAEYQGASLDGKGIAFSISKTLYLRHDNEETYAVAEEATFAGVAEGGERIFYVKGGNLFAFAVEGEETIPFTTSGDVTPVNVSADGSSAFFVSPSALGSEANPNGAEPEAGEENLYRSSEGTIAFVGTVTERDVKGEKRVNDVVDGLGLWVSGVGPGLGAAPGRLGIDSSRTTPDGSVLLFESRADLDGYDPEGHAEVYRYDAVNYELNCLSCSPTLAPAGGEASLQSVQEQRFNPEPLGAYAVTENLRSDGRRAFFQSTEPLVLEDTDGLQDVYEWEAQGVGSCSRPGGCVYLISSGHSRRIDYIYAVDDSGDDVFFRSSDLLLPLDKDETPSIYDARVDGGFPELEEEPCQGEGCRPSLLPAPSMPTLSSRGVGPSGNVDEPKACPKGKRTVRRHGQVRCVKKHHKHRHRSGAKGKGAGK